MDYDLTKKSNPISSYKCLDEMDFFPIYKEIIYLLKKNLRRGMELKILKILFILFILVKLYKYGLSYW